MTLSKSALLGKWYQDVWEYGDLDAIDKYFSPETAAQGLVPGMSMGPEDFRDLVTVVRRLVGPIRVSVVHTVEQGDWLSALIEVITRAADSHAPVHVHGQVMVRFNGDKMVETYNAFDFLTFFEQLRQLPPNSMPLLLGGTVLR